MADENKKNRIVSIELAQQVQPEFVAQKNKDWVLYGKENDYTKYLIYLHQNNAIHGAILNGKANYISGQGLFYEKAKVTDLEQQAALDAFIDRANRFQSWNDLLFPMALDLSIFNCFALQIVFGLNGKAKDYYHLPLFKLRKSKDGKYVYYCNNWYQSSPQNDPSFKRFPVYNQNVRVGSAIYFYVVPSVVATDYGDTYGIPDYVHCITNVATDTNVDEYHFSNTENGMTAQGILNFYQGTPTDDDMRAIKKKFERKHTGPSKTGKLIFNFVDEGQKGVDLTNLGDSELDKKFELVDKRNVERIFIGHYVTDPTLFGIKVESMFGQTKEQRKSSFDQYHKNYIELRRPHILKVIQHFAGLAGVLSDELKIKNADPFGLEVPLTDQEIANTLTFDEKRQLVAKKYNLELTAEESDKDKRLTLANKLGVGGVASLLEVIKDTSIAAERKVFILNSLFGISLKKAQAMIGLTPDQLTTTTTEARMYAMSEDSDSVLEALLSCGSPINDDEVLESKFIDFDSEEAALKYEKAQFQKFADVLEVDVKTIRNAILDLITGDPLSKPETIAKQLGVDVDYVNEQLDFLESKKFIERTGKQIIVKDKGLAKAEDLEPITETEIYTVYEYTVRSGVPKPESSSRPFCEKLMSSGKQWTREDIEKISSSEGVNVWVYRGGFYHNPKTDETTPYCRHIWKAVTKVRRKK